MSTTDDTRPEAGEETANPHGIDHAREQRLVKIFAIVIGGTFVVALTVLVVAIAFDLVNNAEKGAPPAFVADPTPAEQTGAPTSHP